MDRKFEDESIDVNYCRIRIGKKVAAGRDRTHSVGSSRWTIDGS